MKCSLSIVEQAVSADYLQLCIFEMLKQFEPPPGAFHRKAPSPNQTEETDQIDMKSFLMVKSVLEGISILPDKSGKSIQYDHYSTLKPSILSRSKSVLYRSQTDLAPVVIQPFKSIFTLISYALLYVLTRAFIITAAVVVICSDTDITARLSVDSINEIAQRLIYSPSEFGYDQLFTENDSHNASANELPGYRPIREAKSAQVSEDLAFIVLLYYLFLVVPIPFHLWKICCFIWNARKYF